ncbi:MAG: ATP-binding SpoIIE family protein phosphatase, partial [Cellulomonadaceae bacterium]
GPGGEIADLVARIARGEADAGSKLDLRAAYPPGSMSDDVQRAVRTGLGARRADTAWVVTVPGPRCAAGVLVAVPREQDEAEPDGQELTVLEVVARRVGMAVENTRLYAREHALAETLQRAMLPQQADVPGLDVWTYYSPNSGHAQVGGDWYDVLDIAPGTVGLVVGDVVGHDVEAAAVMGQLRSVVRAYAYEVVEPSPVLERVDRLLTGMRIPRAASAVYATMVREGRRWRLGYSTAGHLPPLLLRDGEVTQLRDGKGPMLGFGGRPRTQGSADLGPGDTLVLYTDGLIERRDRDLRKGVTSLLEVAGGARAADAAGIGEELLAAFAQAPEDDVAVLVVRIPAPRDEVVRAGSPRARRWSLPSEPASIARARQLVLRTCQAWGLDNVANSELVVSELTANAVLHGWGVVSLRLFDTGDGLRIEVQDSNPAPPVATQGHPGGIGGYGIQIVDRLADWGWRPSRDGKIVWARLRSRRSPEESGPKANG